ncbi:ADP-ribose pyrophosphatase YjhB (NUDIX family) [Thermocatellispora tengchongensis]|uniref:ADP-ribose pyrophosphatase YjhB (NUDIX family) n=1 Tax=Thermocatellispora tengchongensis TaxID=1073253 RepID=A0A840PSN5_9ACTN|nr:NUDIX domain-containing protein [Thermocatellispora tengchongensis]MBB5140147.1 ADP-ribose pyrophosphatase YjhB (NUDIX family) [Thermocatellispora tengchongensis]
MPRATVRPSARVLLVDGRDRLLLYRGLGVGAGSGAAWFTPGGGVERGEAVAEAAVRELREETGLAVAPAELGPVVATSEGHWRSRRGRLYYSVDSFFFVRVPEWEVDESGWQEYERKMITAVRWWSLPELAETSEQVIPWELVPLMRRLLAGDIPGTPVVLPWHHADPV